MNKEEIISSGLLELYALGIASSEEIREVQQYLALFPELNEELIEIEKSLEDYALTQSIQPSQDVKQKILSQIATQPIKKNRIAQIIPITKKVYRIPQVFRILTAALLILLIESIILIYSFYHKYHSTLDNLQLAEDKIELQEKSNEQLKSNLDIVTNRNSLPVVLSGTPKSPEALAKIFWMKNTGVIYIDPSLLPAAPEGKQYQLWAIIDGKPTDAGMIVSKQGVYVIQQMKTFGRIDAFAITLEKEGGSPTPTLNEMIVSGKM